MYDVITSLGYNCEVSFRLENFFGKINAMPFSWSFELDRDLFIECLNDMDLLFAGNTKLMEDNMICCENYKIKFHPRYDVLLKYGRPTDETVAECTSELESRIHHMRNKFIELCNGTQRTLFIVKVDNVSEDSNYNYICKLYETLNRIYSSKNFTLLVLLEKEAKCEKIDSLESERIKIRYLNRFAPKKHTDTMGDVCGWYKILKEISGENGDGYFKRLSVARYHWATAVIKKRLHLK